MLPKDLRTTNYHPFSSKTLTMISFFELCNALKALPNNQANSTDESSMIFIEISLFHAVFFPTLPTSSSLTQLTPWHLILITTTCSVPSLWVAIIWACGLLQGIWYRGPRQPAIMICLSRVTPIAGVGLVDFGT